MKTAVEWFGNRISHGGFVSKKQFNELLEQAKAMEKEQIIEAYKADCDTLGHTNAFKVAAEQYYNKTYKS